MVEAAQVVDNAAILSCTAAPLAHFLLVLVQTRVHLLHAALCLGRPTKYVIQPEAHLALNASNYLKIGGFSPVFLPNIRSAL